MRVWKLNVEFEWHLLSKVGATIGTGSSLVYLVYMLASEDPNFFFCTLMVGTALGALAFVAKTGLFVQKWSQFQRWEKESRDTMKIRAMWSRINIREQEEIFRRQFQDKA